MQLAAPLNLVLLLLIRLSDRMAEASRLPVPTPDIQDIDVQPKVMDQKEAIMNVLKDQSPRGINHPKYFIRRSIKSSKVPRQPGFKAKKSVFARFRKKDLPFKPNLVPQRRIYQLHRGYFWSF